jgi:class 3 adenylate cyclase
VTDFDALLDRAVLFWEERARMQLIELWPTLPERASLASAEYLYDALRLYAERRYDEVISVLTDVHDRGERAYAAHAVIVLARALGIRQRWREAISIILRTFEITDEVNAELRMALLYRLGVARLYEGEYQESMKVLSQAHALSVELGHSAVEPQIYTEMATVTLRTGDSVKAIGMYEKALLAMGSQPGYQTECNRMRINLASVLQHVGRMRDALDIYEGLLPVPAIAENSQLVMPIRLNMAIAYKSLDQYDASAANYAIALDVARSQSHVDFQMRALMGLAGLQLLRSNIEQAHVSIDEAIALAQHREHTPIYAELQATKASIEAASNRMPIAIERMRSAFDLMHAVQDNKSAILYGSDLTMWLAESGRFEEAYEVQLNCSRLERSIYEKEIERTTELSAVRTTLEAERAAILQRDEERNRILHAVMPESIAERMMLGETRIADHLESVTIMFADIVGFTRMASAMDPRSLVTMLETLFTSFDAIAERYGCERLKTIGDSYMAICGSTDHVMRMCRMALAIIQGSTDRPIPSSQLRIGLHTGHVIAGVMRGTRLSYDIWGDAVNVAARMEENSRPGQILCSDAVAAALRNTNEFILEQQEPLDIQGKGLMTTYWLSVTS